jgi:hypothetical protein
MDPTTRTKQLLTAKPAMTVLPIYGFLLLSKVALGFATVLGMAMAYAVGYFDPSFPPPVQVIHIPASTVLVAVPKGLVSKLWSWTITSCRNSLLESPEIEIGHRYRHNRELGH